MADVGDRVFAMENIIRQGQHVGEKIGLPIGTRHADVAKAGRASEIGDGMDDAVDVKLVAQVLHHQVNFVDQGIKRAGFRSEQAIGANIKTAGVVKNIVEHSATAMCAIRLQNGGDHIAQEIANRGHLLAHRQASPAIRPAGLRHRPCHPRRCDLLPYRRRPHFRCSRSAAHPPGSAHTPRTAAHPRSARHLPRCSSYAEPEQPRCSGRRWSQVPSFAGGPHQAAGHLPESTVCCRPLPDPRTERGIQPATQTFCVNDLLQLSWRTPDYHKISPSPCSTRPCNR